MIARKVKTTPVIISAFMIQTGHTLMASYEIAVIDPIIQAITANMRKLSNI